MIHFLNKVAKAMQEHKYTISKFLDLQKCFDCVSLEILFTKLELIGIRGSGLTLKCPGVSAKHKCPGGGQKVPPVFFCPMSGLTKKN